MGLSLPLPQIIAALLRVSEKLQFRLPGSLQNRPRLSLVLFASFILLAGSLPPWAKLEQNPRENKPYLAASLFPSWQIELTVFLYLYLYHLYLPGFGQPPCNKFPLAMVDVQMPSISGVKYHRPLVTAGPENRLSNIQCRSAKTELRVC